MPRNERVMVVGAGLAGALVACLLARDGYAVDVYERRPDPRAKGFVGGRSINLALSVRGIHALREAGLAERVLADAIPMRGRMIHPPRGRLTFQPYSKDPTEAISSVSRGGLNVTLLEAADEHDGVTLHFDCRCAAIDLDGATATFERSDGTTTEARADWILGADGAFSAVREAMHFLDRFDLSQSYLAHGYKELTIPPAPGSGEAGEFAMEPNALHIWPRGASMMIALPNADRSFTCTLFWPYHGPGSFDAVQGEAGIRSFFEAHFPDAVPLMPTLVADYQANRVSSLVTIRCGPWHHKDTVVILGDAAHAIVPFFGQGMNAAFEDCVLLMERLEANRGDRAAAFASFYERRKADAEAIADLAVENFIEMRDRVASPMFRLRKRAERVLHKVLPAWYTPLYNMITFTRIPYAEAQRLGRRAERALTAGLWIAGGVITLVVLRGLWGLLAGGPS